MSVLLEPSMPDYDYLRSLILTITQEEKEQEAQEYAPQPSIFDNLPVEKSPFADW